MCVVAVCITMSLMYIPELKAKPYVIDGGAHTVRAYCAYELRTHSPAVCSYSVPASYDATVGMVQTADEGKVEA